MSRLQFRLSTPALCAGHLSLDPEQQVRNRLADGLSLLLLCHTGQVALWGAFPM